MRAGDTVTAGAAYRSPVTLAARPESSEKSSKNWDQAGESFARAVTGLPTSDPIV